MDGNYGGTLDVRLQHSDTIIFLDINRYTCLFRALWRSIKSYGRTRPGMAKGCPERLDFTFCKWIFDYPQTKKPTILKLLKALPRQQNVIILKSSRDVKNFLKNA